jgi:hypothetical protein
MIQTLFLNNVCVFQEENAPIYTAGGGSNCDLLRSHVTGSNDATLGEVG